MNTKEKKPIQRQMVEKQFRYKRFVNGFKFFAWYAAVVYIFNILIMLAVDADHIVVFFCSIFFGWIVVGVAFTLIQFLWGSIDLKEIEKEMRKAEHVNEEQISVYEQKISDKENPTKEDIKLQLKIRKLEIRQQKLNFELDLLDKAK
jgi:hypothetical protein